MMLFSCMMQLLLTVSNTLLEIPQTDRESRLESLEVGCFQSKRACTCMTDITQFLCLVCMHEQIYYVCSC